MEKAKGRDGNEVSPRVVRHALRFRWAALPALLASVSGCDLGVAVGSVEAEDLRMIAEMGFDPAQVTDLGGHYVVEGDIALRKGLLRSGAYFVPNREEPDAAADWFSSDRPATQYRFDGQLPSVYTPVTVDISGVPSAIQAAALDAIAEWSDIHPFSRVTLQSGSPGDITLTMGSLYYGGSGCSGTVALADWPASYLPGAEVTINSLFPSSCWNDHGAVVHLVAHEIGHALGLRHTVLGSGESSAGRIHIPGTPTGSDPGSVMNPYWSQWMSWSGFSHFDGVASATLFPISAPSVTASVEGSLIQLEWPSVPGASSYKIYRRDMNFGNEGLCTDDSGWYYFDTVTATSFSPDIAIEVGLFTGEPTFGFTVRAVDADGVTTTPIAQHYFRTWADAIGC